MRVFADASALVAMMAGETDADALTDCIDLATDRLCSPLSAWEAATALCHNHRADPHRVSAQVSGFLQEFGFRFVPIDQKEFVIALDAYARYGEGRHPASLNMADCFAYACARTNDARLLYKGDDFSRTDLA